MHKNASPDRKPYNSIKKVVCKNSDQLGDRDACRIMSSERPSARRSSCNSAASKSKRIFFEEDDLSMISESD
uniref:Uncharacterized protein n=1 Tax=Romanomermis culicivorax TaxID=13658 RepID=A0A915JIW9_ROMCU